MTGQAVARTRRGAARGKTGHDDWGTFVREVASAVRAERESRGWLQRDLARRAGLRTGQVSHLETGRAMHLRSLWAVAWAFDVRVGSLLP